ncbi:Infection Response protein [Parelaphostrongylus tenuis]|uniref:Infection Response protein n=1 Tax=Parelaphostrongylus tenuis TaxID=148309 RepID=A0AAD5RA01_PARTN|nr:Infection Response protein [Parelaphostrongylus tenuis]
MEIFPDVPGLIFSHIPIVMFPGAPVIRYFADVVPGYPAVPSPNFPSDAPDLAGPPISMLMRSKTNKPRVKFVLRPTRDLMRRRSLLEPASIFRTKFAAKSPATLEGDVVVVDDSKQGTSKRSVEITRDESAFNSKSNDIKRNRLFDPLSAISSRLSRIDHAKQFRLTIPHIREESPNNIANNTHDSLSTTENVQVEEKSEEKQITGSTSPIKKPITVSQREDRFASPSSSINDLSNEFNIEIRRDVEDFRVVNSPKKKKVSSVTDEEAITPQSPPPHVHKSETLTVIIPKRRITGIKSNVATEATRSPIKRNDDKKPSESIKNPAEADRNLLEVRKWKKGSDDSSTDLTTHKDHLQPISDDDCDDKPDYKIANDLPVIKSSKLGTTIVPFSSKNSLFSNHFPCRKLLIYGQKFFSAEQYYVWTKAKFCKDFRAAKAVLCLEDPKAITEVDRNLRNVDVARWMEYSWKVKMKASMAKFKQNCLMRYQLFRTIGSVLVEADSDDTYWGIGLSIGDPDIADPSKWRGYNVMGEILMQIRVVLTENPDYADEVKHAKRHLLGSL